MYQKMRELEIISREPGKVVEYERIEANNDFWAVSDSGIFITILMTDELPFELPIHQPSVTRNNVETFVDYDDNRLDEIIKGIDPFEIEEENCRRFV